MDTSKDERRQRMLEKVRKLLAMGRDGRGNDTEQETAMRQANILMAQYGIDEAEADMTAIDAGEMIFGAAQCGPDGKAPVPGQVYRSMPGYAGILSIGVAKFTDSVVIRRITANGEILVFQGEREDVLLARWMFGVLVNSILAEQKVSGWTARGDANTFRVSAASALQTRLSKLAQERRAMYHAAQQQSNFRALVVVDRKALEIASKFGAQKIKSSRSSMRATGAYFAGRDAGNRINIPSGRPVGHTSQGQLR